MNKQGFTAVFLQNPDSFTRVCSHISYQQGAALSHFWDTIGKAAMLRGMAVMIIAMAGMGTVLCPDDHRQRDEIH
ncbi:hypothetical protein [Labrenzia sp. OB1]|uniref:hypothetical protein n=1 Tax=Labrenzia sp. OB1 TaxID=1561204 RepID=UPI0007B22F3B|nr:hypothetical protein [Labrenzia sp. OB1]KZM48811.1 hypothetical protein OA90_17825 [Labrenzia sp. OB1]